MIFNIVVVCLVPKADSVASLRPQSQVHAAHFASGRSKRVQPSGSTVPEAEEEAGQEGVEDRPPVGFIGVISPVGSN